MRNRIFSHVSRVSDFKMHGVQNSHNGRIAVLGFTVDGQLALPTRSFWGWLFSQFPVASHDAKSTNDEPLDEAEFFKRLCASKPMAEVEYEMDWDDDGNAMLLAPRTIASRQISTLATTTTPADKTSQTKLFMDASPGTLRFSRN